MRILILTTFAWAIVTSRYQAAKDVSGSQYTLIDILERMEILFQRVEAYTEIAPTKEMTNIIMKIMVEALTILGIATKEIKQGRASELSMYKYTLPLIELSAEKFAKRLLGRLDIEDALKRLDMLTNEEARMATAVILKATRNIDDNQLRENLRKWLSPPDPSKNHNIACALRHEGSAKWFLEGGIYHDWKSTSSLLWIYGRRTSPLLSPRHIS